MTGREIFPHQPGYAGSALMPVPTAVPPMFMSRSHSAALRDLLAMALDRVAVTR